MKHFALLIVICLFSVSVMGETAADSIEAQATAKHDSTAAAVEGKTGSVESDQNTSVRQKVQEDRLLLVSSCASIVALAGMVIMSFRLKRESGKRRQLKKELEQLKQVSLSQKQVPLARRPSVEAEAERRMSEKLKALQERISLIEARLQAIGQQSPRENGLSQVKYFGINSKGYFVKAFNTSDIAKPFKVTFDDPSLSKGKFELIDLNRIKSADQIDQVVQLTVDSKKIKDAQAIISQGHGTVVRDGDLWKVVEKLKLKLN